MYLYIGSNGRVAAIAPETGDMVWETKLGGGFFSGSGNVCVLEHGDQVYAGFNGHVFALNANTGEVHWQNELPGFGYHDVTLAIAGKSVQLVTTETSAGVDPA